MKGAWWWIGGGLAAFALLVVKSKPAKPASKPAKKPATKVTEKAKQFVKKMLPEALILEKKHGIPYLFTLAQWAVESGWGLSAPGYNYFGIKATSSWKGRVQEQTTVEYINGKKTTVKRKFRAYGSFAEARDDWARVILLPRYKTAFKYKGDPKAFAAEIKKGGYAGDPDYVAKLSRLIDQIKAGIETELKS